MCAYILQLLFQDINILTCVWDFDANILSTLHHQLTWNSVHFNFRRRVTLSQHTITDSITDILKKLKNTNKNQ